MSTPDPNTLQERLAALLAAGAPDVPEDLRSAWEQAQRCIRLLDQLGPGEPVDSAAAETPREGDVASGKGLPERVGRFLVSRELGGGGFGVVYLAWDPLAQREVAVKVPRPDVLLAPELRRRFVTEARAAAALDHPNIVPLYEAGEDGPAGYYLASAYCPGPTLAAWLRARTDPVPVRDAAALAAALADGLAHAHARGVIHRDLKPANILLSKKDTKGHEEKTPVDSSSCHFVPFVDHFVPRITDFGLARTLAEAAGAGDTETGVILGTPEYMAPEQAAGLGKGAGPAADVYALGAILYELLTGRPPFRGDTRLDTMLMVRADEPVPPRWLRANVPADLETVCLKCLEKDPARRYATAGELADDLRRFLAGEPVRARPVSAWERGVKWVRRRPALATGLALAGVAVVAAVLGTLAYARQVSRHNEELEQFNTQLNDKERRLARMLYASRLKLAWQAVAAGNLVQAVEILDSLRPAAGEDDHRGFEWYHLKELCRPLHAVWRGHQRGVTRVAVSPDGRTVASGSGDATVRLWDLATGQARSILRVHDGPEDMRFSPDGRSLAMAFSGGTPAGEPAAVWVWDPASARRRLSFSPGASAPWEVQFTPDGRQLVTFASGEVAFATWDPVAGRQIHRQHRPQTGFWGFAVSPDGRLFASGAVWTVEPAHFIVLWDVPAGREHALLWGHRDAIRTLAFSPDGRTLASASADKTVRLWDVAAKALRATLSGHRHGVHSLAFSPDGQVVASATFQPQAPASAAEVRLWDAASGEQLEALERFTGEVDALAFVPNSRLLVVGCADRTVRLLDTAAAKPTSLPGHAPKELWALAFAPDGKTLASVGDGDEENVILWDMPAGRTRKVLRGHEALVTAVAYAPDGRTLASAGYDGKVRLWDAATGELRSTLAAGERLRCLAFSPDGTTLAAGTKVKDDFAAVKRWDVATGRELPALGVHDKTVRSVAFSRDGKVLFSASEDGTVRLWDAARGQELRHIKDTDGVGCLAVAPDGRTLATANKAGLVKLWDVATGQERSALRGHAGEVFALTFSPDGRTLATAGEDRTVRLWMVANGEELLTLRDHLTRVNAVAFSPDGNLLASGSHDGYVGLWHAAADGQRPPPEEAPGPPPSGPHPGSLDRDFGNDGQVLALDDRPLSFSKAVVQPDGRIVVAATIGEEQGQNMLILRYLPDGQPDPSFGTGGRTELDFFGSGCRDRCHAVLVLPDGRIVGAGEACQPDGTMYFALVWLDAKGRPDERVRDKGKVVTEFFRIHEWACALALQPDGKILAAGSAKLAGKDRAALVRYHPDGSLDEDFGDKGTRTFAFLPDQHSEAKVVAVRPDGKILVGGVVLSPISEWDFAAACFDPQGRPDPAFGKAGCATVDFFGATDESFTMAEQPDGKLVLAGRVRIKGDLHLGLARLLTDGSRLDPTFGGDGRVTDPAGRTGGAGAVAVLPGGKLVVVGNEDKAGVKRALVARYERDGHPDVRFGARGRVTAELGEYTAASTLVVLPDGKLLVAGDTSVNGRRGLFLRRYHGGQ